MVLLRVSNRCNGAEKMKKASAFTPHADNVPGPKSDVVDVTAKGNRGTTINVSGAKKMSSY